MLCQPVSQVIHVMYIRSASQPLGQPVSHPVSQSATRSASQPVSHLVSQLGFPPFSLFRKQWIAYKDETKTAAKINRNEQY